MKPNRNPWMTFDYTCPSGMALALARDWLADRGISIGPLVETREEGSGCYSFRDEEKDFIVTVEVDSDADFDGERYVDRSRLLEVKIVPS